ncbi:MAG: dihydroorotate dehydrogenase-like protein [Deltaproteobacteria bacterium]|nr:dihydroorotate dehydrogenase-like protein [Deltaproteobacteria bacterium]
MDLSTKYMGMDLGSPIVLAACPLSDDVDIVSRCVDAGAGAVVMRSLFEEQITKEQHLPRPTGNEADGEATQFSFTVNRYLEQIARIKDALDVPVIGSINGTTLGGWVRHAEMVQRAGADAIELNVYYTATDPDEEPRAVEQRYTDIVAAVRARITVPLAVKLSPFFSAPVYMARKLDQAGAEGLVMFNRFYQPDIDATSRKVTSSITLSDSSSLPLRLRWLAATYGKVKASLACTGGIHTGTDAVKATLAGADVVQMASAVLRSGPNAIRKVRDELTEWMRTNHVENLQDIRGELSLARCKDPVGLFRANYLKTLHEWHPADSL